LWKTPATKLAKQFGLSDVGLAKICKRHAVPRPPRGYWARLAHGQRVRQTPLPKLDDAAPNEIQIFRQSFFNETVPGPISADQPKTVVPEALSDPHMLVKQTRTFLRSTKRGEDGIVHPDRKVCLNVRVAPATLGRGLLIVDSLLKKWEELGGSVSLGLKGNEPATLLRFGEVDTPVEFFEETEREATDGKTERHWRYRNWKYRPTGRLVMQISGATWGCQQRWADGKKQRAENRIDSFIAGVREVLETTRLNRLDEQCVARQRKRVADVREAANARRKAEEQRRSDLVKQIRGWRRAKEIREYLGELQAQIDANLLRPSNPVEFTNWFDWAKWYANHLDPLTPTPNRPEFIQKPQNTPIEQLDLTRDTTRLVVQLSVADSDALYLVKKDVIEQLAGRGQFRTWHEICRLLEGLGYDMSGRKYYDW
jgi:hypothetical protein